MMAVRTGEELQLVSTFSIQIFLLEILDYLSRWSVPFWNFLAGQYKIVFTILIEISRIWR